MYFVLFTLDEGEKDLDEPLLFDGDDFLRFTLEGDWPLEEAALLCVLTHSVGSNRLKDDLDEEAELFTELLLEEAEE